MPSDAAIAENTSVAGCTGTLVKSVPWVGTSPENGAVVTDS